MPTDRTEEVDDVLELLQEHLEENHRQLKAEVVAHSATLRECGVALRHINRLLKANLEVGTALKQDGRYPELIEVLVAASMDDPRDDPAISIH
jgi:hypothetical protein